MMAFCEALYVKSIGWDWENTIGSLFKSKAKFFILSIILLLIRLCSVRVQWVKWCNINFTVQPAWKLLETYYWLHPDFMLFSVKQVWWEQLWILFCFNILASLLLCSNTFFLHWIGRFLGELTKQVFSDLAASKYQVLSWVFVCKHTYMSFFIMSVM